MRHPSASAAARNARMNKTPKNENKATASGPVSLKLLQRPTAARAKAWCLLISCTRGSVSLSLYSIAAFSVTGTCISWPSGGVDSARV